MRVVEQRADQRCGLGVVQFIKFIHRALAHDEPLIPQRLVENWPRLVWEELPQVAQYSADDVLRWVGKMRQDLIMRLSDFKMREAINRFHDNVFVAMIERVK